MLCDRILRNLGDELPAGAVAVSLTWQECRARALQKPLADGRTLRIILPPGVVLRQGDVVHEAGADLLYVDALPAELLAISPPSPVDLLRVIYAFGNLHLPVQMDGERILTPADGPAMAVLRELGLTATPERRPFDPLPLPNGLAFRLSGDFAVVRR